jgi:uncharacterized membrane protein
MLRRAFAIAAVGWALALPLATWTAGSSGLFSVAYAAAVAIYGIGAWVCHQRPDRSFYLWATQMPVCARCTGIYLGGALAAIASAVAARRRRGTGPFISWSSARWRVAFAIAALPTLATLVAEWTGSAAPSNTVRAIAGLPIGAVVAWAVLRAEVN